METVIIAIALFALGMGGLATGVLFGRPAIKGSCGGPDCGGACSACPSREGDNAR